MQKNIKILKRKPCGNILIPPSKSVSHRAVICSLLSKSRIKIANLGNSNDINATTEGMKKILNLKSDGIINCNESGSTLRFLIPIASAISDRKYLFTGKGKLLQRPMEVFETIYKEQKLSWKKTINGIEIKGSIKPGVFKVKGNISSQFISGLLFALPLLNGDSEIIVTTQLESVDYINLTIDAMNKFGVKVITTKTGWKIKGNQKYKPTKFVVEADYTQASYFLVAKKLGCKINIKGLNKNSKQGDKEIINIIAKTKSNNAIIVDAHNIPDLVPSIAVLMCFLKGKSKIINAARVRMKESDRLHAMTVELNKIGGKIKEDKDGLTIAGVSSFSGGIVETWGDHRIAMALAVASIKCTKPLMIKDYNVVKKSYPTFWKDFEKK